MYLKSMLRRVVDNFLEMTDFVIDAVKNNEREEPIVHLLFVGPDE